jgi:translocator protein
MGKGMARVADAVVAMLVSMGVCFAAAALGGLATYPNIDNWYASLNKPAWTPPDAVFGPVWMMLYFLMALAAWLVWRCRARASVRGPLALFGVQLGLNAAWSWLFFGLHSPGGGMIDIVLLLAAIVATLAAFWRRSRVAGILLVPYLAWVAFAGILNFAIWRMNT